MSKYVIETGNLTKQYGAQKSVASLNIHVQQGRIYGLLGRNGAGKTTTMKMLLGLTPPTAGEVKIWGKPLKGNEKKAAASHREPDRVAGILSQPDGNGKPENLRHLTGRAERPRYKGRAGFGGASL